MLEPTTSTQVLSPGVNLDDRQLHELEDKRAREQEVWHQRWVQDILPELAKKGYPRDLPEPEWAENYKASYWKRWGEGLPYVKTMPLPATAANILGYLERGYLLRSPEPVETEVQDAPDEAAPSAPLYVSQNSRPPRKRGRPRKRGG